MSKFCGNCGAVIDDNAAVCGYCGFPCENAVPTAQTKGLKDIIGGIDADKKKKITKIAIAAGSAVIALIVLISVISIIGANTGYKGAVKKMVAAYEQGDEGVEKLIGMASKLAYNPDKDPDDVEERFESIIESYLDDIDDKVGNVKSISYKINDVKDLSDRKFNSVKEDSEEAGCDISNISEIKELDLTITVKGSNNKEGRTLNVGSHKDGYYGYRYLYLVKEGSEWKFLFTYSKLG